MRIGIDFDNTIVSYDSVFYNVAREQNLVPASIVQTKDAVKKYLHENNQKDIWTELQGFVYGTQMRKASVFPYFKDFLEIVSKFDYEIFIISHKTKYPYQGPQYDLHKAAIDWLEFNDLFNKCKVFFESSITQKIERIKIQKCSYFIDDLPEVLNRDDFPVEVKKILFAPNGQQLIQNNNYFVTNSWQEIANNFSRNAYANI